jgi:hypothetical protein
LDVEEMYTDGGYNSEDVDQLMRDLEVELHQTAIRGGAPAPERVGLADFSIDIVDKGYPQQFTCPGGQTILAEPGHQPGRFIVRFDAEQCAVCPLREQCNVPSSKLPGKAVLYLNQRQVDVALKRQRLRTMQQSGQNPRAAVEATVRSVKHPFRQGKLPVRGKFRMASMMFASALMVNVRRIHAYQIQQQHENQLLSSVFGHFQRLTRFLRPLGGLCRHLSAKRRRWSPIFSASYAIV